MNLQQFFDEVPRIRVQDPLARLLGCAVDGELDYGFGDAVRLTGHACPTVASAYWMTYLALEHLYPQQLPQRGGIKVEFREDVHHGTNGVMAAVVQMLTGAEDGAGFKGLGGRFSRAGLIRYRPDLLALMRFTRLDTQEAVEVSVDTALVPADPALPRLLERCAAGRATAAEEREFGRLWMLRVRRLLLDCARDPAVFMLRPVKHYATPCALAA